MPKIDEFLRKANTCMPLPHNAFIGTIYTDGSRGINPHNDKMADIDGNSWIIVWRLGAERTWELSKDGVVVHSFKVCGGDAIFMNARGNAALQHGVPNEEAAELSGSIVGRKSHSFVPWPTVFKRAKVPETHEEE